MTVAALKRPMGLVAPFAVSVGTEATSTVITLRGEADAFTLPTVAGVLARVISERDGPVVVDLAETSFIDVRTLRALGRASQLLARSDRSLVIRRPSGLAVRVLAFLGLSDLLQHGPRVRRPGSGPPLVALR